MGEAVAQHGFQHRQLRLELHPADLDHPRGVGAVEQVLRAVRGRIAMTYDDLAGA